MKYLKDHYIVCGYGRMGKTVAKELSSKGIDIIAIEKKPPSISRIRKARS